MFDPGDAEVLPLGGLLTLPGIRITTGYYHSLIQPGSPLDHFRYASSGAYQGAGSDFDVWSGPLPLNMSRSTPGCGFKLVRAAYLGLG